MRRRLLVPLAACAAAAVLAACGGTDLAAEASPPAEPPADAAAAAPAVEAEAPLLRQGHDGQCWTDVSEEPCVAGVPVGTTWTFQVYTHCGVEYVYFDGRFWTTDPPLGAMTAPAGWGDPIDEGVITLEAADRALYLSAGGDQVVFAPAPADFEPQLCL